MTRQAVLFYKPLEDTIISLEKRFPLIPTDRRAVLGQLTEFIESKVKKSEKVQLIFICTHNSRRSHIAQVWAQTAAAYYRIPNVASYSGGTEATAFNPRAVNAMEKAGFRINGISQGDNPIYAVSFAEEVNALLAFSKKYDAESNPREDFAAIMTCSHADDNCPVVLGMEKRISLPYNDPKDFDGTARQDEKYLERVLEIGTEILYAFSNVRQNSR